jgi:hypothetical protein
MKIIFVGPPAVYQLLTSCTLSFLAVILPCLHLDILFFSLQYSFYFSLSFIFLSHFPLLMFSTTIHIGRYLVDIHPPPPMEGGYAYTYTLQSILHIERSVLVFACFKAQWDLVKKYEMLKVVFIESYDMHVITTRGSRWCSALCIYVSNCHLWYFCEDDILQCRV